MGDWSHLTLGYPQIAALLVLAQRFLEELYSRRNTAKLIAAGAKEFGRDYYFVVAVTHLAWIVAVFFLIPDNAAPIWPLIWIYLLLQVFRYWVIFSLGKYWTHRIISLAGAPLVRSGPFAYARHPNYAVTILETFILPLAFGAVGVAVVMTVIWAAVIRYKILIENNALSERRASRT